MTDCEVIDEEGTCLGAISDDYEDYNFNYGFLRKEHSFDTYGFSASRFGSGSVALNSGGGIFNTPKQCKPGFKLHKNKCRKVIRETGQKRAIQINWKNNTESGQIEG